MLTIRCPHCTKAYRLAPEHLGKSVRCQDCSQVFEATEETTPAPIAPLSASPPPISPPPSSHSGQAAFPINRTFQSPSGKQGVSDQIDYTIHGDDSQFVEVTLDPGETVIAESGAMMYMTSGIEMQTVFGDPSSSGGFWNKVVSAGKRVLTGESLFMTTFTNNNPRGREHIAFAAPTIGRITPMHLDQMGGEIICQKGAFLCGAKGLQVSIAFQKKIGVGLFGGEGFIMQRIRGDGIALVHAGGAMVHRVLAPGERIRLDTGCLMALGPTVDYDVQFVGGFKNTLFGGEGLFMATVTGPGPIWLQSLPFSRLASSIVSAARGTSKHAEEGSVLGGLGLGSLLMGNQE
ncbi:TIGR00266 family protein [Pirellulaceae bacterium SH467]|jgi:uncharacterized protein (TIGR00266 family)